MTSRARQIEFFASLDAEEEIERPRHYPRPVRFLLEEKLRRALNLLGRVTSNDALCVCGGSGMDAEWLAHLESARRSSTYRLKRCQGLAFRARGMASR